MPRCVRLQSSLASANPLCTRTSRMLTGCFALTRSLPQKRVTFSISTSPSAISAADLPPERSICICLMCMPAECMDASIPALPGAQLFAHLRLFANSRPVSHNSAARHTADYLRILSCSGCLLCHMTCEHTVQPLALIA